MIKDQLASGIVECVQEPETITDAHYLPHHAVIRCDKDTTKLRIVYDASAKTTGPSLNDCLYVGPPFGQYIFGIILRFCVHSVALASIATRFYDPLEILAPFIVQFKMLFQELCKAKLGWDDPLTGGLLNQWTKLVGELKMTRPLVVPRQYFKGIDVAEGVYTLQGFCDASARAYAAVVYLRAETAMGRSVSFVAAKTRVAPITEQTIPRLELLAALLYYNIYNTPI